ncbi:uncharacterized protein LOC107722314 isoform X1 [Sinocyclocheilus rhinocerous]|uniref:uncharacterized protein LOC107722314 isoform X1 n=1 Tax=Sinocyclocheilus rhinocerous TaxID=307959 RepID=UPI0007B96D61|nr:PREDICTED: uncharacterized protein LOC107722314 isoform X1 [Sinocyclocheilus rhinocerous]XP_016386105.1 PREDICTED: uncharacterized protein LOC107722314 isoform X1 [Sinocyclocheilus rhinocerous]XP_016386106.1 PREDICTED: uncharacterized protein LOC107722314 isoform X1 [Sinocyclocheilus rhinocerous]
MLLIKVRYQDSRKFIRLQDGFTFADFVNEGGFFFFYFICLFVVSISYIKCCICLVHSRFGLPPETNLHIYDDTETEIDEDILQDVLNARPDTSLIIVRRENEEMLSDATSSSWTDILSLSHSSYELDQMPERPYKKSKTYDAAAEAKEMVRSALKQTSGGDAVLAEYSSKNTLSSEMRRVLVNILVGHMVEMHGRIPTRNQKETYALGVVTLFPSLKDPFSKKGYEHFYDTDSGTGYIAWRLKTVQRNAKKRNKPSIFKRSETGLSGPSWNRCSSFEQQDEDTLREAIAFLTHSTDEAQILLKMRETFHYRHRLVHDPNKTTDILKTFPTFLNTKGLVNQDFSLLFSPETSSKLLEMWDTTFKAKIIEEAIGLTSTAVVCSLLLSANNQRDSEHCSDWDSDMATLLLLLHLLPPSPGKKVSKISASDAINRLVVYQKSRISLEQHLQQREGRQPYLLAVGRNRNQIEHFYIALNKNLIPCQSDTSLCAFDELFKAHFVFNLAYDEALLHFYTFIQTTIYMVDVGKTKESPRVKELRAKLLN